MDLTLYSEYTRAMCDFDYLQRLIFVVSPSSEIDKAMLDRFARLWNGLRAMRKLQFGSSDMGRPLTSRLAAIHDGQFKIREEVWSY